MNVLDKSLRKSLRMAARRVARRPARIPPGKRLVSFSFDDFPLTAVDNGARRLESREVRGTFYAALGLAGAEAPCGTIGSRREMLSIVDRGHEFGCHTFGHLDCARRPVAEIEDDCRQNRELAAELAQIELRSFSFPFGAYTPATKRAVGEIYDSCRTGDRGINSGEVDLSALYSVPLYERAELADLLFWVDSLIEKGGWLVFYTHDVSETPTRWGCSIDRFDRILDRCIDRGAEIVTVAEAVDACTELEGEGR